VWWIGGVVNPSLGWMDGWMDGGWFWKFGFDSCASRLVAGQTDTE
jgi:hypothetical protein